MGFAGNELQKAAEFLHVNSSTGLFILFLFLSSLLAFFVLAFSYAFIDTPLTSKVISRSWVELIDERLIIEFYSYIIWIPNFQRLPMSLSGNPSINLMIWGSVKGYPTLLILVTISSSLMAGGSHREGKSRRWTQ